LLGKDTEIVAIRALAFAKTSPRAPFLGRIFGFINTLAAFPLDFLRFRKAEKSGPSHLERGAADRFATAGDLFSMRCRRISRRCLEKIFTCAPFL